MGKVVRIHQNTIIANHLVLHGYGDWMPNDIRGSGSTEVRKAELEDLAPIHFGRKKNQPSRKELTKFFDESRERLEFDASQFDNAAREVIAGAFASLI